MIAPRRRSGGPRTPEGRKAASRNAIKTGAYAQTLLPGDDRAAYEALESALLVDYAPSDLVSEMLVRKLAGHIWKMMRLQRVEHAVLGDMLSRPVNDSENPAADLGLPPEIARKAVSLALQVSSAKLPALAQAYAFAARLADKERITAKELARVEADHPVLWTEINTAYAERGCAGGPEEWLEFHDGKPFYQHAAAKFLEKYDALPLLLAQEQKIRTYIPVLQERRLLKALKLPDVQRAHDDLDRAFFRTLAELRKHQQWLSDLALVDVTPIALEANSDGTQHTDAQLEDTAVDAPM